MDRASSLHQTIPAPTLPCIDPITLGDRLPFLERARSPFVSAGMTEAADVEASRRATSALCGSKRSEVSPRYWRKIKATQDPIEGNSRQLGWRGDLDANRLATPVEIDHQAGFGLRCPVALLARPS